MWLRKLCCPAALMKDNLNIHDHLSYFCSANTAILTGTVCRYGYFHISIKQWRVVTCDPGCLLSEIGSSICKEELYVNMQQQHTKIIFKLWNAVQKIVSSKNIPGIMFPKCLHSCKKFYTFSKGYRSFLFLWLKHTVVFFKCLKTQMYIKKEKNRHF